MKDLELSTVIVDLVGIQQLSDSLALRCEHIGLVRDQAMQLLLERTGYAIRLSLDAIGGGTVKGKWGTDGWILEFADKLSALAFCRHLLTECYLVLLNSLIPIKPMIGLIEGGANLVDGGPTDARTLALHAALDKTPKTPFSLLLPIGLVEEGSLAVAGFEPCGVNANISESGFQFKRYQLSSMLTPRHTPLLRKIALGENLRPFQSVHTENESHSTELMSQLHGAAEKSIRVIGGGAPFGRSVFKDYAFKEPQILSSKQSKPGFQFLRIAMLYEEEPLRSHFWLLFNAELLERYPHVYKFRCISIPKGVPKSISFHVVDQRFVFIGLRGYNAESDSLTMRNAICCDSAEVAASFGSTFDEYWRSASALSAAELRAKGASLPGLSHADRGASLAAVEEAFGPNP